ncbi:STE3-domain-containing protein [Peniophora sp. CONT]|nr:STE3-domain-containing protein [Peniophora sp. CONT]
MAVDPTYPLLPIAYILATAMLFLVLLTSFIRQSWNLGVAFLCFWLFLENLTAGIDNIIWSNNADIKLYVYCDIVSHIQVIASVVKPMATLIITRRLYLITSLQSVELPNKVARRRNFAIEWAMGLVIPVLVAGPLYYIVQPLRFEVDEGFGCGNSVDGSILDTLLTRSWAVIPPLMSVILYYPKVARIFYRQSRDINHFLQSNDSVTRTNYMRILILASIDVILTLPIGIATIVLNVVDSFTSGSGFPFYRGWTYDHADWEPESFSYEDLVAAGTSSVASLYFVQWTSPALAFAIFGLFGVTSEARASYWRIICTVCGWFGWKPTPRTRKARPPMGDSIEFGEGPMDLEIGSNPSYINPEARAQDQSKGISGEGEREAVELKNVPDKEVTEGPRDVIGEVTSESSRGADNREPVSAVSVREACAV